MSTLSSLPSMLKAKDNDDTAPTDSGKNPGEALSKFDFSQVDPGPDSGLGSQGEDHSDTHAALASMSSEDALDYAISHMGPVDHVETGHLDAGHVDALADTSHDT